MKFQPVKIENENQVSVSQHKSLKWFSLELSLSFSFDRMSQHQADAENPFCPQCGAVVSNAEVGFSFQNSTDARLYWHSSTCPNHPKNLLSPNNSNAENRGVNFKRFIAFLLISAGSIIGKNSFVIVLNTCNRILYFNLTSSHMKTPFRTF
jgi:hypothetical protein